MPRTVKNSPLVRLFYRDQRITRPAIAIAIFYAVWIICHPPWKAAAHAVDPSGVVEAANQVIGEQANAAAALWQDIFFPASPTYLVVVYLASVIGGFMLIFLVSRYLTIEDDTEAVRESMKDMVWVIVLLAALALQGRLFASAAFLEKSVADAFIGEIDEFTEAGLKFRQASALMQIDAVFAPQIKACEGKTGQQQIQCLGHAYRSASSQLDVYQEQLADPPWIERWRRRLISLGEFVADPEKEPLDKIATAFWTVTSPAWEAVVKQISSAFATGIFALIDILAIFLALIGPLAAAFSILPVPTLTKAFFIWQTGFLIIYGWKLALIVLDGLSSQLLLSYTADVDTIWFGVVTGLIFPIVALIGAVTTGLMGFQAVSSIAGKLVGLVRGRGAPSGGGGSAPAAPPKGRPRSAKSQLVR